MGSAPVPLPFPVYSLFPLFSPPLSFLFLSPSCCRGRLGIPRAPLRPPPRSQRGQGGGPIVLRPPGGGTRGPPQPAPGVPGGCAVSGDTHAASPAVTAPCQP